jgi:hypothetical protein
MIEKNGIEKSIEICFGGKSKQLNFRFLCLIKNAQLRVDISNSTISTKNSISAISSSICTIIVVPLLLVHILQICMGMARNKATGQTQNAARQVVPPVVFLLLAFVIIGWNALFSASFS